MLHVLSSAALLALVLIVSGAHSQQQQMEGDEPPTFPLISDTPFLDTDQFNPSGERESFFSRVPFRQQPVRSFTAI
jgi:hypothetical protein